MEGVVMKLENVKSKIDAYFDGVKSEELVKTLTEKFGMQEYDFDNINAIPDEHIVGNAEIA